MVERRVQQSGASTLTVSLPADWVDAVGLGKGSRVLVEPTADGGLTVYPVGGPQRPTGALRVLARALPDARAAGAVMCAAYAAGWERVDVRDAKGLRSGVAAHAREAAHGLAGMEPMAETRTDLEFTASLDAAALPLPGILRRLDLTATAALADAVEALATRDPALAEAAGTRAGDGERLRRLARRQSTVAVARPGLTRALAGTLRDALVLRVAGERLADAARDAARVAEEVLEIVGFHVRPEDACVDEVRAAHAAVADARALAAGALFGEDPERALKALASAETARSRALEAVRVVRDVGHASLARRLARTCALLADVAESAADVADAALERVATRETPLWTPG